MRVEKGILSALSGSILLSGCAGGFAFEVTPGQEIPPDRVAQEEQHVAQTEDPEDSERRESAGYDQGDPAVPDGAPIIGRDAPPLPD